jgi:hypothetical protein
MEQSLYVIIVCGPLEIYGLQRKLKPPGYGLLVIPGNIFMVLIDSNMHLIVGWVEVKVQSLLLIPHLCLNDLPYLCKVIVNGLFYIEFFVRYTFHVFIYCF